MQIEYQLRVSYTGELNVPRCICGGSEKATTLFHIVHNANFCIYHLETVQIV